MMSNVATDHLVRFLRIFALAHRGVPATAGKPHSVALEGILRVPGLDDAPGSDHRNKVGPGLETLIALTAPSQDKVRWDPAEPALAFLHRR
jgi:hypothetical protein